MRVADKLLYNGEVKAVPIEQIESSPNYRDPRSQRELLRLGNTMKTKGQTTPILLEEIATEGDILYRRIAGERRVLSAHMCGLSTLNARIYKNLTELERMSIQTIENKKKRYKRENIAEQAVYDMVTILSTHLNKKKRDSVLKTNDYYGIPLFVRSKYSVTQYARDANTSSTSMQRNFHYSNLHGTLKRLVLNKKLPFCTAAELGRIPSKKTQLEVYAKYKFHEGVGRKRKNRTAKDLGKLVSQELRREERNRAEKKPIDLRMQNGKVDHDVELAKILEKELDKVDFIRGLYQLLTIEPDILTEIENHHNLDFFGTTIEELWSKATGALTATEIKITQNTNYLREIELSGGKKKDLRDIILEGELSGINGDYKVFFNLKGKTEDFVIKDLIFDPFNPRNTKESIDWDYVKELGDTMDVVDQLNPILVRPTKDGLMVVIGEMRTRGRAYKGHKTVEGFRRELTDFEARLIQIIEDYSEQPSQRELEEGIASLWELRKAEAKEKGVTVTKRGFIEETKWFTESLVNNAIAYNSLDDLTKNLDQQKIISHGTAVELAKVDESKRYEVTLPIIAYGMSSAGAKKLINEYLEEQAQEGMAMFQADEVKSLRKVKRELAGKFIQELMGIKDNLRQTLNASEKVFTKEPIVEKFYHMNIAWNDLREQMMTIQEHNDTIQ